MNRLIFILTILVLTFSFSYIHANPFSGETGVQTREMGMDKSLLLKITIMQQNLKNRMSSLIIDFKKGSSFLPLLSLLMISFFYGVLHAAGPGHGKAFAAGYILCEKPKISRGIIFGSSIAFFHGISGAILVLILNLILKKTISGSMAQVEYFTKIISYSLLSGLGLMLFIHGLMEMKSKKEVKKGEKNIILWSFSAGLIPCPGVIMIMLFCLSMGMPYFGFFLALAVSAGMALTISIVVMTITMGKKISYSFISKEKIEKAEVFLGIFSGIFIMAVGSLFLLSSIKIGGYFV